jgi:hypothetical protein
MVRTVFEKPKALRLVNEFPNSFYGAGRFITVVTRAY